MNKQEVIDVLEVYRRNMAHILGDDHVAVKAIETCEKLIEELDDDE